mgnify:CR=1 FL=1
MSEEVAAQTSATDRGLNLRLIVGLVVAAALALFVFQNTDDAEVSFLWMDGDIPLYLLLLVTVVLTIILTLTVTWVLRRRQ